tara:strand:+ start:1001 stop:1297 length:297 start_codon:yes stop_codon:yes gene_type:complete
VHDWSTQINKGEKMKTIKIHVKAGVVTDVIIPETLKSELNYEIIDHDIQEAEEEDDGAAARAADKPEPGKVYALTGGPGSRCIANGYSWKASVVEENN